MHGFGLPPPPHWLETKVPPPVVMLLLGLMAYCLGRWTPWLSFQLPLRMLIVAVVGLAGLLLNVFPKLAFGRARTTVNPLRPDQATTLVSAGIYRYTRNPMYVGQALLLLAWVLYVGQWLGLFAVPIFVLYITRFQIVPEERVLAVRFADEYAEFRRRVRRWL